MPCEEANMLHCSEHAPVDTESGKRAAEAKEAARPAATKHNRLVSISSQNPRSHFWLVYGGFSLPLSDYDNSSLAARLSVATGPNCSLFRLFLSFMHARAGAGPAACCMRCSRFQRWLPLSFFLSCACAPGPARPCAAALLPILAASEGRISIINKCRWPVCKSCSRS